MPGAPDAPAVPAGGRAEPRHGLRLAVMWVVASVICTPLVYFVLGPHLPPGAMSSSASGQQFDTTVLAAMATPVVLGVWIYFGYALTVWRHKDGDGDTEDGPPIHGHTRIQVTWISVTAAIVLFLAAFGTYELIVPAGVGAGEGPQPIWKPDGRPLQVQVIAQQWRFSYRYPQFGGFETPQLVLPANEPVQFNVTSLDVIHSFWAYQLGVKADANPQLNDVAYTTPKHTGGFTVRCAELCGIWHGAMSDYGTVVTASAFTAWATRTEAQLAPITRQLPPYALTYDANLIPQLGKALTSAGLNGAGGGFYGPQDPAQP